MIENRRSFHQELDEIRLGIVRLAAMATEFIPMSVTIRTPASKPDRWAKAQPKRPEM